MSEWISVEDKTPSDNKDVLVFDSDGNIYTADCCKGHLWNLPCDYADAIITHWMPLPEPPKEQS